MSTRTFTLEQLRTAAKTRGWTYADIHELEVALLGVESECNDAYCDHPHLEAALLAAKPEAQTCEPGCCEVFQRGPHAIHRRIGCTAECEKAGRPLNPAPAAKEVSTDQPPPPVDSAEPARATGGGAGGPQSRCAGGHCCMCGDRCCWCKQPRVDAVTTDDIDDRITDATAVLAERVAKLERAVYRMGGEVKLIIPSPESPTGGGTGDRSVSNDDAQLGAKTSDQVIAPGEPKCWACGGRHDVDERSRMPGGFRLECASCGAPLKHSDEPANLPAPKTPEQPPAPVGQPGVPAGWRVIGKSSREAPLPAVTTTVRYTRHRDGTVLSSPWMRQWGDFVSMPVVDWEAGCFDIMERVPVEPSRPGTGEAVPGPGEYGYRDRWGCQITSGAPPAPVSTATVEAVCDCGPQGCWNAGADNCRRRPPAPGKPACKDGQHWECDQCGETVAHGDSETWERIEHADYRCPNHAHPHRSCDGILKWQPGKPACKACSGTGRVNVGQPVSGTQCTEPCAACAYETNPCNCSLQYGKHRPLCPYSPGKPDEAPLSERIKSYGSPHVGESDYRVIRGTDLLLASLQIGRLEDTVATALETEIGLREGNKNLRSRIADALSDIEGWKRQNALLKEQLDARTIDVNLRTAEVESLRAAATAQTARIAELEAHGEQLAKHVRWWVDRAGADYPSGARESLAHLDKAPAPKVTP